MVRVEETYPVPDIHCRENTAYNWMANLDMLIGVGKVHIHASSIAHLNMHLQHDTCIKYVDS